MTRQTPEPTITAGPKEGLDVPAILRAAADLIEPEGRWTQEAFARGRSGRAVRPDGAAAVRWCVTGALRRVGAGRLHGVLTALRAHIDTYTITTWNDAPARTQAEVVAALRAAADQAASASPTTKGS